MVLQESLTPAQVEARLNAFNPVVTQVINEQYHVSVYKVIYRTIDAKGVPTICSGLIMVPSDPI
ncbi:MAG: hypothetical protein NZ108_06850, partial [Bacteroidia bacterium]|nr:hypothetical protein [Bacteroidia bacterium]